MCAIGGFHNPKRLSLEFCLFEADRGGAQGWGKMGRLCKVKNGGVGSSLPFLPAMIVFQCFALLLQLASQ
jgi:hypothetical protein